MKKVKVKICGITAEESVEKVSVLGADAIGIQVGFEKELAPNEVSIEKARKIALAARKYSVDSFLLTIAEDAEMICKYASQIGNTHLQLLGDVSLKEISTIKEKMPSIKVVKVISVTGKEAVSLARKYGESKAVDMLLLDSKIGNKRGGTGKTHDWNISKRIVYNSVKPVWLAGGLNPENIGKAIQAVKPYGVDVETGVQKPDGSKDYEKIEEFIKATHTYQRKQ